MPFDPDNPLRIPDTLKDAEAGKAMLIEIIRVFEDLPIKASKLEGVMKGGGFVLGGYYQDNATASAVALQIQKAFPDFGSKAVDSVAMIHGVVPLDFDKQQEMHKLYPWIKV